MLNITPEMTSEQLRSLSENLKSAIISMAADLNTVTNALVAKNEAHAVEVESLKNRHAAELAKLIENHEDMTEHVEANRAFLSAIAQFITE